MNVVFKGRARVLSNNWQEAFNPDAQKMGTRNNLIVWNETRLVVNDSIDYKCIRIFARKQGKAGIGIDCVLMIKIRKLLPKKIIIRKCCFPSPGQFDLEDLQQAFIFLIRETSILTLSIFKNDVKFFT